MRRDKRPKEYRQKILHWAWPVIALTLVALLGAWFLQSTIPRHIVLASGLKDGMYHEYAQRYKEILARDGVTVEERVTGGADENERLLHDPKSGVDVAFMHGGVVRPQAARIKTPASYASEAYTLREHIGLVRRAVLAKANGPSGTT